MARRDPVGGFWTLLGQPGARWVVAASATSRLSFGTLPLSLLLVVHRSTGSFAAAGVASAALSTATLSLPLKARLADRRGWVPVVVMAISAGVFLGVITLGADLGLRAAWVYVALSGAAGALAPPLGPVTRAWWASRARTATDRQLAYTLDLGMEDLLLTTGPVVVGLLTSVGGAPTSLAATAALLAGGSLLLLWAAVGSAAGRIPLQPATSAPQSERSGDRPRRRWSPRSLALLVVGAAVSLGLGAAEIGVVASTTRHRQAPAAGYLLAVLALGSLVGGLAWSRLHRQITPRRALVVVACIGAFGLLAAAAAPTDLVLGVALVVAGAAQTPTIVVAYTVAESRLGGTGPAEATSWVNTSVNAGYAIGAAVGGVIASHHRPAAVFIAATVAIVCSVPAGLIATQRPSHSSR